MRDALTWLVVLLPAWVREVRWYARQDYVSKVWLRESRRVGPAQD